MNKKYWLIIILAFPFVITLSRMAGKSAAERVNERENNSRPVSEKVELKVVASTQSAEGVTQNNLNMDFLKNLEDYYVARVTAKTKEILVAQGYSNVPVEFIAESNYVFNGPYKLAVTRLRQKSGGHQVIVTGIVGDELRRVTCASKGSESVPISYGECGDKIAEIFGRRIGQ